MMRPDMKVLTSSESVEWYTPPRYVELARAVMGGVDLDPASTALANRHFVHALSYFTREDDGLALPWYGNVFLNPPYGVRGKIGSRSSADVWVDKTLEEWVEMRVEQAVVLTKAVPGYDWWDDLFNGGWPGSVCITRGRIAFVREDWIDPLSGAWSIPEGVSGISKAASCFWYVGNHHDAFYNVFKEIGRVIKI